MIRHTLVFLIALPVLLSANCARHQAGNTIQNTQNTAFGHALTEVSGGKQAASVGSTLDQAVVVQVNDDKGTAVPNALIHFNGPAGVRFNPRLVVSDSSGQASTTVSLGSSPGRYKIAAWIQDRNGKRIDLPLEEIALGYEQVLGRELAARYCSRCHDQESSAERVSNYDNLKTKPHALSDGDTLNKMSDDELLSIIEHGGPALNRSAEMPAYGYTLSKADIQALIAYMRAVSDPAYQSRGVVYAQK
jgi:mono/diheme cytochrome c family protein